MSVTFAFVIPTRNSNGTFRQALVSMAGQSHKGWRAVIVDDASVDGTPDAIMDFAAVLGVRDKITLIRNTQRLWEVANVLEALKHVGPDEVVCRLDLDDYLCDLNALEIIAAAYKQHPELDALYTAHRWFDSNGITKINISAPMPTDADPYVHPWVSSHMKTWRKSVSDKVSDANYRGPDPDVYIKRAGDQAIYLPVLKLARKRLYCPIPMYAYRCDMSPQTFQTEDAHFQKKEADFLRKRGFIE